MIHNKSQHGDKSYNVIPLRIDLAKFQLSRSQKRVLKRNKDLKVIFRDAHIDEEKDRLFDIHKQRFTEDVPGSLNDFVSAIPSRGPCVTLEC